MKVIKRSGESQEVQLDKLTERVQKLSKGLSVDPIVIAKKTADGLFDGIKTIEIDKMLIQTSAFMTAHDPDYSKLAARLLSSVIDKEVQDQDIDSFTDYIEVALEQNLINKDTAEKAKKYKVKITNILDKKRSDLFEYFGLKTVYDRYLLKHPVTRKVLETPQYFFMRVAIGISDTFAEIQEVYETISKHDAMLATPTLFNSGTPKSQMSSCYLLDAPDDSLTGIFDQYAEIAQLSKWAGGIGLSYSKVRSRGSLIKGTNGPSNGIVPWLKILDSAMSAVNQGGKRKGSACVYLEPWHPDILEFLELRDNTGDHESRTHNLNLANWIPDLFMKRVKEDGMWSLFDPTLCDLADKYGDDFDKEYLSLEANKKYSKQVKARDLYARMMTTLAQTGNGWMCFKDSSNKKSNQTFDKSNIIHSSNLCVEILEVTNSSEVAVCNLGSINLSKFVKNKSIDFEKLKLTAQKMIRTLDRAIDKNFYPVPKAKASNSKWRPVGLGLMGLQDVFFMLDLPFDSAEALKISTEIQKTVYFAALQASNQLAKTLGCFKAHEESRTAAQGLLQPDLWGIDKDPAYDELRESIKDYGLRNSLVVAIAPTATIASIVGCYECIEPQTSNLFKRETLSGEFPQINKYLVAKLKELNLWTEAVRNQVITQDGSVQGIDEIPKELKAIYKTAWELSMKDIITLAAARAPYIDQSQSLNLFIEAPTIGKLSSMYMHAWEMGLKTTYYLRSRPASKIKKTIDVTPTEAITCSLENPEACESCQ